ncbi:MAG: hypothetical protein SNJ35_08365, partial [Rikenellaceae bacterium]
SPQRSVWIYSSYRLDRVTWWGCNSGCRSDRVLYRLNGRCGSTPAIDSIGGCGGAVMAVEVRI